MQRVFGSADAEEKTGGIGRFWVKHVEKRVLESMEDKIGEKD